MPDHVSRETTAPQTTTRSPAEPAPGCYLLDGDLLVVLGVVDGLTGCRLVDYLRTDGRAPLLVLEAWPRSAQRLPSARAGVVLWIAQQWTAAERRAAVRDREHDRGEAAALRHVFLELAKRLQDEARNG